MEKVLLTALLAPLAGAIFNGVLGSPFRKHAHWVAVLAILVSWAAAYQLLLYALSGGTLNLNFYTWVPVGDFRAPFGLLLDALSAFMAFTVTTVSLFIHIYSAGYMHGDPGYRRYFAYLNLFVFSMLLLVLANNFLLLFVGWEAVGLCSYLLIGFWYEKKSASDAGKKAFIVNRIGDAGFLLGILTLFSTFGSVEYTEVFERAPEVGAAVLGTIGLLLFIGAVGKSAQFPLYVWLPDAMEGPTPVSALIHAATMVTAGVYMVARAHAIFGANASISNLVASIGAFTALFSASIALVNDDIKRILAYSTISQLGYMFIGVGLGAYTAGMFHLFTHAFFKALLFLAAGSVMHALHGELNIWKMGGLWRKLPWTGGMFLIGALALAGIPPFAGFFSKDEILKAAYESGHQVIWAVGTLTVLLTAFYMFRAFFVVFLGKPRDPELYEKAHESPLVMLIPMGVLAFGSLVTGFPAHGIAEFLGQTLPAPEFHDSASSLPLTLSLLSALIGIGVAAALYLYNRPSPETLIRWTKPLYKLLKGKYYVDEIYEWLVVKPVRGLAVLSFKLFDRVLIDGTVNALAWISAAFGGALRKLQTGAVSTYALWMLFFLTIVLWLLLI